MTDFRFRKGEIIVHKDDKTISYKVLGFIQENSFYSYRVINVKTHTVSLLNKEFVERYFKLPLKLILSKL